jgi:hypothetical protein
MPEAAVTKQQKYPLSEVRTRIGKPIVAMHTLVETTGLTRYLTCRLPFVALLGFQKYQKQMFPLSEVRIENPIVALHVLE